MNKRLSQEEVATILALSKNHKRISEIARIFNVKHTAIIYHLNKNKPFIIRASIKNDDIHFTNHTEEECEHIKTYQDYLDEEQERIQLKQLNCKHENCIETIKCKDCGKTTFEDLL